MFLIEGSINKLVRIFLLFKVVTIFFIKLKFLFKFSPPSVVTSFLFSGTIQTNLGLYLRAKFNISLFEAISKLSGIDLIDEINFKSLRFKLVHRDVSGKTEYDNCYDSSFSVINNCLAIYDFRATRAELQYESNASTHSVSYTSTKTDRDSLSAGVSSFTSKGELDRWEYLGTNNSLARCFINRTLYIVTSLAFPLHLMMRIL